jgi:uncharacterized protein DUF3455
MSGRTRTNARLAARAALAAAMALPALAAAAAGAIAAERELPAAIAAPEETPMVTLHAAGAQLYECKEAGGKLTWAFREPIASLMQDGHTVGRHYAGPAWEHADGSAVVAKSAASAPGETADDAAWLKLDVVARRGSGILTPATSIQRINTHGGALAGACAERGAVRAVPYSADYVFLRKGG